MKNKIRYSANNFRHSWTQVCLASCIEVNDENLHSGVLINRIQFSLPCMDSVLVTYLTPLDTMKGGYLVMIDCSSYSAWII